MRPKTATCRHCRNDFNPQRSAGRAPVYCSASCRQGAYVDRRLGRASPHPIELPEPQPGAEPAYEAGSRLYPAIVHALRPDGLPDGRRFRPTLCGTATRPALVPFTGRERSVCGVCADLAYRFPAPRRIDPSADLAVLTALLAQIAHRSGEADLAPLFHYLHGTSTAVDKAYVC